MSSREVSEGNSWHDDLWQRAGDWDSGIDTDWESNDKFLEGPTRSRQYDALRKLAECIAKGPSSQVLVVVKVRPAVKRS